jgi:heme exporter protein A
MLHIDDLSRRYGRRWALIHVSTTLAAGQGCMLVGANGSGKSTLIKCLATALHPHQGRALLDGEDLWLQRARLRPKIAYLGHQAHVYGDLSATENLKVWADLGGYTPDISQLLNRVGLDPTRHDAVRTFSAGMQRRIALARMLLKKPKLVLLDEPFTALDPTGRELMISVIAELKASGAAVLMATHHPAESAQVCERALALDAGKVKYDGPSDSLPAHLAVSE